MNPTISNAFNEEPADSDDVKSPQFSWGDRALHADHQQEQSDKAPDAEQDRPYQDREASNAETLATMQVNLHEANFGWSLELTPMYASDAVNALQISSVEEQSVQFLVSMEQSAWQDEHGATTISDIAQRMEVPVIEVLDADQLVMEKAALQQLVGLCRPSKLAAVAVEGEIDRRDADAISKALDDGRSPLLAELRAVAALEVMGDRGVVLHSRDRAVALRMIAENFRHYLAAWRHDPIVTFEPPQDWQIERLLSQTGMLTVRPIETQSYSTSIDIGINTTEDRFDRPADQSLIYDIPSNTWHDEH